MAIVGHGGLVNLHLRVNQTHVNRILTNMKRVTSRRLLELVDLEDEEIDLMGELLSRFPESTDIEKRSNAQKEFYAKLGLTHLIQGWRIKYRRKQAGYEMSITHTKSSVKRVAEILAHLDKGTSSKVWMAKTHLAFFDYRSGKKQARSFPQGTMLLHAETKAHNYMDPTIQYALTEIAPRIRRKVLKEVDAAAKGKATPGSIARAFKRESTKARRR